MTANKYTKFQVAVSILVAIRKGINDVQDIVTFTRSKKEIIEQWLEIFKAVKLLVVTPCEKKGRLYPSWTFNYDQEVVYERKAVSLKLDPYKVTAAEFIVLTVSHQEL